MNDPRSAAILGVILTGVFVLGITYLAMGERLGIKSAGPNVPVVVSTK